MDEIKDITGQKFLLAEFNDNLFKLTESFFFEVFAHNYRFYQILVRKSNSSMDICYSVLRFYFVSHLKKT